MRAGIVCLGLASALLFAVPSAPQNILTIDAGLAQAVHTTNTFATNGGTFEVGWRHYNRGRTAYEFVLGYAQMGLQGEIQNTIAAFDARMRYKNQLAQEQGGPGNGYIVPEYGIFETYYGGADLLFHFTQQGRFAPFVSLGAGLYNWRVPFRIKFRNSPFFGEQHAYDAPGVGNVYSGVLPEETVDFTKHKTSGGLNAALGSNIKFTRRVSFVASARGHLVFSNGSGNRELGIDDQDYENHLTMVFFKGGVNYRF
jgi:hypothetical protein